MDLRTLSAALAAVCPIDGVGSWSDGDPRPSWPAKDGSRWRVDFRPEATDAQRQAAMDILAGYVDPAPVPAVSGDAIIGVLSKSERALCSPDDRARIAWRDDVPTTNAKLKRIADAIGTTPDVLRQRALGNG